MDYVHLFEDGYQKKKINTAQPYTVKAELADLLVGTEQWRIHCP